MQRSTLYTIGGCVLALGIGAAAATWRVQDSLPATSPTAVPAQEELSAGARSIDPKLAQDLKAEKGAKRWLLLLSAAEHATAKEMPGLIRAAGNDSAAARMLGARWAELDPMHMFRSMHVEFLQPDGSPGALPDRHGLMDTLFEHWSKNDPQALLRTLTDVPNFSGRDQLRMTAMNQLMKVDVELGMQSLSEWGIRHYMPDMRKVKEWAAKNPKRAAEVTLKSNTEYAGQEALRYVGKAWAESNPEEGLRFAATLDLRARSNLADAVIRSWADRDLKATLAFVNTQTDPAFRTALGPALMETWGKTDPEAALAWGEENLKGAARNTAIAGLIKYAAETNLERAAELVSGLEGGAAQRSAAASLFETWFKKGKDQRNAAFEWLAAIPDRETQQAAFDRVQWDWVWRDPVGVREFIDGPHGKMVSESMIRQVASNQTARNPEDAMKWAKGLPEDRREGAKNAVLSSWLSIRPEGAVEYARNLPSGAERDQAIETITGSLIYQSPQQTGDWYRSLPAADQKKARGVIDRHGFAPSQREELLKAIGE
jgi:hypothetical protein